MDGGFAPAYLKPSIKIPTRCNPEINFIYRKPILLPEYYMYFVESTETKFDAFKKNFYGKEINYLNLARRENYLIIGSTQAQLLKNKKKTITQAQLLKDKNPITQAIINSMFGNIILANAKQEITAEEKAKIIAEKKAKINVLNYENEVLRGNINNRINKADYVIKNNKKLKMNFEGDIDDKYSKYADMSMITLKGKLISSNINEKEPVNISTTAYISNLIKTETKDEYDRKILKFLEINLA